jgi:nucleoside-diphosphate-sugar epimerase
MYCHIPPESHTLLKFHPLNLHSLFHGVEFFTLCHTMTCPYPSSFVLITGATGHVGFRVLIHALSAGYSIRAAVRSSEKAKTIRSHPLIKVLNPASRLTFVIVPDLCKPNAYDEAARGVDYVIHIASPLMSNRIPPPDDQDAFFTRPAVRGTLNILEAARKSRTVRRVVITSSITALIPFSEVNGSQRCSTWISPTDRIPFVPGPYANEFEAYAASKVAALQEAETWMATHNPSFDVVHLHPSFVEGRNDLALHTREVLKGTNAIVLSIAMGKQFDHSTMGSTVHLEDVARVHVQALDELVPGNMSYILSQNTEWEEVTEIVGREFPDAVEKGILPNSGTARTHPVFIDSGLAEEVFGFRHLGLEEQVRSVVGHYLEVRMNQRKSSARK